MPGEPVAIIGVGLRFPGGSESLKEFDEFLRTGQSGIGPIPEDRWDVEAFRAKGADDRGKITTSGGGFLDRLDLFDAPFFNISPKEAPYIDPQQRMVLETAWHALEHAGVDAAPLRRGNGGVYIGATSFDYALALDGMSYADLDGHLASGITMFPMSGRLSYFLGWRGPSVNVDTACSSSLSALHMAVQGLRLGECDIALCGGVNALHHPRIMVMFSHGQMLAADGRCKTFDESADGYSRAEGCGMVVLKRLSDAERDGDEVLALITGTAIGQDGDSAGLTVPHGPAQESVFRSALSAAGLAPADIQYVEAHGTGTPLGDPIELGAISGVFAESHSKENPLLVGSVKTNLGHMEPASGIVGVIKTVAQLQSGTVYPHLNVTTPSKRIPWDVYPVRVPLACTPWPGQTRRALVNSFGFAGTIAAAVVQEAPARPAEETRASRTPAVFTLSAKNAPGLRRQAENYLRYLDETPELDVGALCHAAAVRRSHLPHRVGGLVTDRADLVKLLQSAAADRGSRPAPVRKVAFMFTGQGSQYPGMGDALYERFPVFRERVDECDRLFAEHLGLSIRDLMFGRAGEPARLDQTGYTQPALFTLEYSLARMWMAWGVRPNVLIGHSIGEVTAAAVTGLLDLADAVALVAVRSRLMQSVRTAGGMAALDAPVEEVTALLAGYPGLAVAAVNSPAQTVVSGAEAALTGLIADAAARGLRAERLTVSHAFHSPLMAEVFDEFREALAGMTFRPPAIPLISNVTGTLARYSDMGNPDYWVRHIGEPVLFLDGLRAVEQRGRHAFVEIGPSTALTATAKRSLAADDHRWIASLRRRDPGAENTLRGLADLYAAGLPIDWTAVHDGQRPPHVTLPAYAFERKRYWLPSGRGGTSAATAASHPLLGKPTGEDEFTAEIAGDQPGAIAGHVVGDRAELPAAGYVEVLLALQDAVFGEARHAIRDLRIVEPLVLPADETIMLRTRYRSLPDGGLDVEIGTPAAVHATASIEPSVAACVPAVPEATGPVTRTADGEDVYTDLASVGRRYATGYRLLTRVNKHRGGVVSADLTVARPATVAEHLPVELLEAGLQAVVALDDGGPAPAPVGFGAVRFVRKPRGEGIHVVAKVADAPDGGLLADVDLSDERGRFAELRDIVLTGPAMPFLHRLVWQAEVARQSAGPAERHVLVLGGGRLPATDGVKVSRLAEVTGIGEATVTDICWFWQPDERAPSVERWRDECERNYRDLLSVVATLSAAGPGFAPRLWLVTERAQWLPGDRPDGDEQLGAATLWGFGHTLLNEYPRYRPTLVDLPAGGDPEALLAALTAAEPGEFQIAYRGGRRYVRRVLADEVPAAPETVRLRGDRTYLISGGSGGLGLATAEHLVDAGARCLVLVSRSGRARPEYAYRLDALRARADVRVATADLGSAEDVERVFTDIRQRGIPLGGIVHAAGVADTSLIANLTWEAIDAQLRAQAYGGWLLHEGARNTPELDFFVVHSSVSAVIGGATQAHYAAAFAFLDGLVAWRSRQGLPALGVNWGMWSRVGVSARLDDNLAREVERGGLRFFSPSRALRTLDRLLAAPGDPDAGQPVAGQWDWDRHVGSGPLDNALFSSVATGRAAGDSGFDTGALLALSPAERLAAVEQVVLTIVAAALHADDVEAVDSNTPFVSLGLDSLMALDVKNGLESALRLPLPASLTFDHPSPRQLAEFVDGLLDTH